MARINLAVLCCVWMSVSAVAQTNRYMIFFTDKAGSTYTTSEPQAFLNEKAIQRRIVQNIDIVTEDLPVSAGYIQQIKATGANVLYKTKWMNGVLVECTGAQLNDINLLSCVNAAKTEYVAPGTMSAKSSGGKSGKLELSEGEHTVTADQLAMLGIDEMHADGFHGEGVIVAVMDGGFLGVNATTPFQELFSNRINTSVSFDFTANSSNVFRYSEHGTSVLSVMGIHTEEFTGGAYKATYQLYVTENVAFEYRIEEYNWLFAAERADSAGVDVINTSLGYNTFDDHTMNYTVTDMDGRTAVITRAANIAASKGMLLVNSAGNSGNDLNWRIITAPADNENVLATGNINMAGLRSATSSIGPSADGRIKPDVVALGTGVAVIRSNGNQGFANGTSLASPLVTALVAGLRQKYPDLKNAELLQAIRKSASQAASPDNFLGYGVPHYRAVSNYIEMANTGKVRFSVYPNPVKDIVTMEPIHTNDMHVRKVSLVNSQGQMMRNEQFTFNWPENTYSINVSSLMPGVYFLILQSDTRQEIHKLLKL